MPRPEGPLEPDVGVVQRFARELRRLREKAGSPTYRELARRAHYSQASLAKAAGGRDLPSLAVTLTYVQACGGNTEEWEAPWREVAAETAPRALDDLTAARERFITTLLEAAHRPGSRTQVVLGVRAVEWNEHAVA